MLRLLRRTPVLGAGSVRRELKRRYKSVFGRKPNLKAPSGFNELIVHRILHDRDPRLKTICDKLAVREVIRERVGPAFLVPLLGVWKDPSSVPWDSLPERYVLKPSHSSGLVAIVRGPADRQPAALAAKAAQWLSEDFFDANYEWGYRNLPRRLLAEPLLDGPAGGPTVEAQVWAIHGKTAMISVFTGEKGTPSRCHDYFDAEGRVLRIRVGTYPPGNYPLSLDEARHIVSLAEPLADGYCHLRVDFYLTDQGPKIGELTAYTNAGQTRWTMPGWDERLGRLWLSGRQPAKGQVA